MTRIWFDILIFSVYIVNIKKYIYILIESIMYIVKYSLVY